MPKKLVSVILSIILFFSGVLPSYSAHCIAAPSFSDVETVFFQPKPQPCKPPHFNPKGNPRNSIYVNAKIVNGRLEKGTYVGSSSKGLPRDFLEKYPDCVVAQCECNSNGGFNLGYTPYWIKNPKLKNKKGLTAHFINKELIAVYDKDGTRVYKKSDEDTKRHLYINAHIEGGKRVEGVLVGNYSMKKGIPTDILDTYSDFIVENVNLDKNGQLVIAKRARNIGKEHAHKKGTTVVVKNKSIDAVYDKEGKLLYQKKGFEYEYIKIYSGAKIINGKRSGGTLAGAYTSSVPDDVWEKNPQAVVEVGAVNRDGALRLAGKLIWDKRIKLVGEKNIIVVRKNNEFVEAYNARGEKIFSKLGKTSQNALYINARIIDGKRVGGELAGVYPHGPHRQTIEKYRNYIICNVRFDSKGTYKFLQKRPWKSFPPYINAAGNTIVVKDNTVYEAYDSEGRKIFAQGKLIYLEQLLRNIIHVDALYRDGKIVGGRCIGSYQDYLSKKVIKQYPDCIIANVQLNKSGGCSLARETVWASMAGYSRAQGITLIREHGEFVRAYNAEGKCIFTKMPLIKVFIDAQIIQGKRIGGTLVGEFKRITNKLLTRYPNCVIEGLQTNDKGKLYLARRVIAFGGIGVKTNIVELNEKGLLVHISNGALKTIYNKEGRCIKADNITSLNCSVYTNRKTADIHEPNLVRNFVGSYPDGLPEGFLQEFPNCTVTHVPLDNKGELRIGEKTVWGSKPQFSNAQNTSVIVLQGHVIAAFTEKGEYIYSKPSYTEGSRHSLYVNAWIENGKRTGGLFVNAFPVDIDQSVIATYPNCIIAYCTCTSRGGLRFAGEDLWWEKEGYENKDNMTVVVKNGTPVMVFDGEGNEVWYYRELNEQNLSFPRKTEVLRRNNKNGENAVFINSEIIEGRKARGDFVGNWPSGIPANVFDLCPDSIVTNVTPDDEGNLSIGEILLLSDYGLESGKYMVCFEHARPVKIFDQNGNTRLFWGDKDAPNVVYKNAVMVNGKLAQGDFIKSFPEGISRKELINQGDCIIIHCTLKQSFGFDFQKKEGLSAHFINGFLKTVYDNEGNVLLGRALKQFNNAVFTKPQGRYNINPEGTFCGSYPRGIPQKVIKQHPNCLIFNCASSSNGDVAVADQSVCLGKQYALMKDLTVVIEQGVIGKIVTKENEYIYHKRTQNRLIQVFIGAEIINGKRKGGSLIRTDANYLDREFWEKCPDAIIELHRTSKQSKLIIGGQLIISKDLENKDAEEITIVKKEGKISQIFNKKGKEIIMSQKILARNKLYINAHIEKGKRVGGELMGIFSGYLTAKIINQYPDCIIVDAKLNGNGGFSMGHGLQWHSLPGHEYEENVTVEVKNRKAAAAYDRNGNKIYPHAEGSRNSVYLDATIKGGTRHGGRFVAAFPGGLPSAFLKKILIVLLPMFF